jgi:hypothetical protein
MYYSRTAKGLSYKIHCRKGLAEADAEVKYQCYCLLTSLYILSILYKLSILSIKSLYLLYIYFYIYSSYIHTQVVVLDENKLAEGKENIYVICY